jgi:DNA-binding PadR family transcriptional regulator
MASAKTKVEHEADRTQLLRILVVLGFQRIPPDRLLARMDQTYHTLSPQSLDFHLRYMADKGWIEIGEEKMGSEPPQLAYVLLTAEGVEEYDRRRRSILTTRKPVSNGTARKQ